MAGVTVVRSGSFGAVSSVFLRGGESDYVRVLLDGVALNQPGGAIDLAGLTMGRAWTGSRSYAGLRAVSTGRTPCPG